MNAVEIANFLGWCTLLNFGLLILSTIALVIGGKSISKFHGRVFGIDPVDLSNLYFQYLGNYKTLVFVFNLVPYLALRITAA